MWIGSHTFRKDRDVAPTEGHAHDPPWRGTGSRVILGYESDSNLRRHIEPCLREPLAERLPVDVSDAIGQLTERGISLDRQVHPAVLRQDARCAGQEHEAGDGDVPPETHVVSLRRERTEVINWGQLQ